MNSDYVPRTILAVSVFILTIVAFALPFIFPVSGDTDAFSASLTVGNSAPNITHVAGQSVQGVAAGSAMVHLYFNVTDPNGALDINVSSAFVWLNRTGETLRNTTNCTGADSGANTKRIDCSLVIYYYDGAGTWSANFSIRDNSSDITYNWTTVTFNNVDSVTVVSASIAFSGSPGSNDNAASPNPQRLNNTGNLQFSSINVTGFNFASGSNYIVVGNVTMNTTDTGGAGTMLVNETEVVLANSTLDHGPTTNATTVRSIYFWLDVPGGTNAGSYSSQSNWVLEAIQ